MFASSHGLAQRGRGSMFLVSKSMLKLGHAAVLELGEVLKDYLDSRPIKTGISAHTHRADLPKGLFQESSHMKLRSPLFLV